MTKTLSDLVTALQEDVPDRNSIPSSDQYERCAIDAVNDFSRRAGRIKIATLTIVSGTATYDLPDNFVRFIRMESLQCPDNIMHTAAGLVPLSANYSEEWTIADGQITFYPTPTYAISRYLHYQAGWVLDESSNYQEMGDAEAEIILLLAASKALNMQANKAAQAAWQYQQGDERVNKEKVAGELRAQAKQAKDDYLARVSEYNGAYGSRARYSSNEYS